MLNVCGDLMKSITKCDISFGHDLQEEFYIPAGTVVEVDPANDIATYEGVNFHIAPDEYAAFN
jgi:hypothetical protein